MSNVQKWEKRIKLRRISTWAIVILSLILIIVILLTIYGLNVGNFVISVPTSQNGLALSENKEFTNPTSQLNAPGLDDIREGTLSWFNLEEMYKFDGSKNDSRKRYICYGFYLMNAGKETVNYEYTLTMFDVSRRVDSALRVLIRHSDTETIYAKAQEYPSANQGEPEEYPYMTTPFLSKDTVCTERFTLLQPGEIRKFTVIMWLEGNDPQCTNDIKGGTLKMDMNIKIV